MNRKTIIPLSLTVLPLLGASRPNILFIIADDASFAHFGANGSSWVKTPGFDRVAGEGINFLNCYTPNAKSAPSRACILTGLYSWQLGEAGNHLPNFPSNVRVVTEALAENGYQVAYTGKGWAPGNAGIVNGVPRELTGKAFNRKQLNPPTSEINSCDYIGNFSEFLDQTSNNEPWFFWLGCYEPHRYYETGSGERLGGKRKSDVDNLPTFFPDNDVVRTDLLDYALEIEYFDRQIVGALAELERRKQLDNTLIVVTSDNGMPFPRCKGNSYEYSTHMPMAMMWRNGMSHRGRTVNDYINFVDLAPTFLELSSTRPEKHRMTTPQGKSLNPIFRSSRSGNVMPERNYTLLGRERHDYGRPLNQGYPIRAIVREGMLYLRNYRPDLLPAGNPETGYPDCDGSPTKTEILNLYRSGKDCSYFTQSFAQRPEEELYDLTADPFCINNLASLAPYSLLKQRLRQQMERELRSQGDPRMSGQGDRFDRYPFAPKEGDRFYENVVGGLLARPWEITAGWLLPTDYIQFYNSQRTTHP